jgi:hypothetical protein
MPALATTLKNQFLILFRNETFKPLKEMFRLSEIV